MNTYTRRFYEGQRERSRRSAQTIVPLVTRLINPRSIVDVGCGTGAWLSVFREQGVEDVIGADGAWVEPDQLFIPAERFVRADLKEPVRLERRFDLVMSLEVAEHLPQACADTFVDSLTGLGPAVLFSAAIPGQGGTHHVNEQWPDYWVRLFRERGFGVADCIRKQVWSDENVEWWYAQNMLLFVKRDEAGKYPLLKGELSGEAPVQINLVHPRQYLAAREPANMPLRRVLPALPAMIAKDVTSGLRTLLRNAYAAVARR